MTNDSPSVLNSANGNAPGGRGLGEIGSGIGPLAKPNSNNDIESPKDKKTNPKAKAGEEQLDEGFGIEHKDVKGSLKVHIKLDLEADIRIIARIKGDIAIGLL